MPLEKPLEKPDSVYLLIIFFLLGLGVVAVFSSSFYYAWARGQNSEFYYMRSHLIKLAIGLILFFVVMNIPYKRLKPFIFVGYILILLGLILTLILGHKSYGARRWLFNLQVSEFAKIWLIVYLASFLTRHKEVINSFRKTILPGLLIIGPVIILILIEPSFSMASLLIFVTGLLFFTAGLKWRYFCLGMIIVLSALTLLYLSYPHARLRLASLFGGQTAYQIKQSLIAIGSGGLLGTGPGGGRQKFLFLPCPYNDFIFASVAEEFGFLGSIFILGIYLYLYRRGIRIARFVEDDFGRYLVLGFSYLIFVYFLCHVSVSLGILPPTGLPLPFLSFGGSALISNLIGAGLVLNVSRWRID
ncbi:MAG: FtsW/RodA/SpoVE family cell cycle protein [candidate division WOR-3 bacterium]